MEQMMKKMRKQCHRVIAMMLMMAMMVGTLAACGGNGGSNTETGSSEGNNTGENGSYTVSIKTNGGMTLEGLDVYIYADSTLKDIKKAGKTDANGIVNFDLPVDSNYAIAISGAPKGYEVAGSYSFSGNTAIITLNSKLVTGDDISTTQLGVGDVMYDFTVTNTDGTEITLSEILKEKDMVMLNFWYTTCSWCMTEFPLMSEAYEAYKDDIAIIALDPIDGEAAVKAFQQTEQLPFDVAACPASWSLTFGISGYPTSVVIDRYGVICAVESGAITSLRPFNSLFSYMTSDNYVQKLSYDGIAAFIEDAKPTQTMDTSENISAAINKGDINVTYRPEEGDGAETTWPFIIGEKDGDKCIYASNSGYEDSYAIIYADVELKKGQAVGFDYWSSTEMASDIMYVIVNDDDVYQISGNGSDGWQSCYPCVAEEDGTYEVALCYLKDSSTNEGDDTVYVKNFRVVDKSDIDVTSYIPRYPAMTEDGFDFTYADIVFNSKDGYYHIGSADGPLLLADLMGYTQFNEEKAVIELVVDGSIKIDGKDIYNELGLVEFCSYASNSNIYGLCPVTEKLADLLKLLAKIEGFNTDDKNEWLKICKYYEVYGPGNTQLEDPIRGLATFSAYKATLGKNVSTNFFYYDRVILPRGLYAEFIPSKSGVYRITSHNEASDGVEAWIFDENKKELLCYLQDERMFHEDGEVSMVFYMEAGTPYYIDIAFWDLYATGYIYYDIEFLGSSYELFRLCSPGYFTYDSGATGEEMYYTVAGGIDVVLGTDGIYYEDLGKDASGKQIYGSKIYADFTGITGIFNTPIMTNNGITGMIDMGGFDFSKSENDMDVLRVLEECNGDVEATKAALKEQWGVDYDAYYEEYKVDEVFKGIYHGSGKDYTEVVKSYINKIDKSSNEERNGCVIVTKELAEILQLLMDKYTFAGVDDSWRKLCYYYDYLGPEK